MKLKESETKLEGMLVDSAPENVEVPAEETNGVVIVELPATDADAESKIEPPLETHLSPDKTSNIKNAPDVINNNLTKKVTNIENEQLNKSMHNIRNEEENHPQEESKKSSESITDNTQLLAGPAENAGGTADVDNEDKIEAVDQNVIKKDDQELKDMLRKNILSCVEKITRIEEMKTKKKDPITSNQVFVCYCELWSVSLCCEPKYP